jgi:hypothetical protein
VWDSQHLTTQWSSTTCYGDGFTFILLFRKYNNSDAVKEDEVGTAYGIHEVEDKCKCIFGRRQIIRKIWKYSDGSWRNMVQWSGWIHLAHNTDWRKDLVKAFEAILYEPSDWRLLKVTWLYTVFQ